jgi:hypothetical protein
MHTFSKQLSIFICCILRGLCSSTLERNSVSLVLETLWRDESLNLGGFGVWLLAFTLWLYFSSNDEFTSVDVSIHDLNCKSNCKCLPDIIFLVKTKELSDFRSTLGTQSLWLNDISQARDFTFALFDN